MRIETNRENLDRLYRELDELNRYAIEIGIFAADDSEYAMIANVHEFGTTIHAKNGKFLAIPTPDGIVLKESVKIPERSFVRSTFDEKNNEWIEFLKNRVEKLTRLELTARQVFEQLGARIASDIQMKIRDLRTPPNSALTIANKGSDNPLIDKGGLRQRVTWKVVNSDGFV